VNIVTTVTGESNDSPALFLLKPGVTVPEFAAAAQSTVGKGSPFDALDPYGSSVFFGFAAEGILKCRDLVAARTYVALENGNGHAVFTVTQSADRQRCPFRARRSTRSISASAARARCTTASWSVSRTTATDPHVLVRPGEERNGCDQGRGAAARRQEQGGGHEVRTGVAASSWVRSLTPNFSKNHQRATRVYVIYCAMNAEDGRDHFQLGMFRTITIAK